MKKREKTEKNKEGDSFVQKKTALDSPGKTRLTYCKRKKKKRGKQTGTGKRRETKGECLLKKQERHRADINTEQRNKRWGFQECDPIPPPGCHGQQPGNLGGKREREEEEKNA